MAEVKNIQINVDTKGAVNAMENLSKATHDVSASFEEVYGDLQPLTTRMGEAEDRLYELANAGQTATQEYQDLLETVGRYRKVQIQTDMAVDAAATTMHQKLGGALGGVAAGFSIAQGIMGAFGSESEELERQLLKVQAALAISEGISTFREAIPSIKAFGTALKGAIGASGIGLLVVALGTIYAYWDDISAAVNGVSKEQQALNAKTEANVKMQQGKLDSLNSQDNILKLQGKTEKQITEIKLKQIDAVIAATKAQLVQQENTKKAEVAAAKRNQEYLKLVLRIGLEASASVLRYLAIPIDAVIATANKVAELLGYGKITAFNINAEITKFTKGASESIAEYFFDPDATAAEANKTIAETKNALLKLENDRAGMILSLRDMDKQSQENRVESNNKELSEEERKLEEEKRLQEEALKAEEQKEAEYQKKLKEIQEQNLANSKSLWDAELAAVDAKYKELEERAKGNAEEENAIMIAKMNEQNDINLKYQNEQYKINEEARQREKEAQAKAEEDRKKLEEAKKKNREDALTETAATLGAISDLFGEQTAVGKSAAIAEATISTYLSAQKAYDSTIGVPFVGPVLAPINAGLAIAAGIKNIKAITAVKTPNGGGGGGGQVTNNFSGGAAQAPSFNVVGNSGMNQLAQIQQTPIQAYVVSGEVTSAQALDRNRIKNATL